MEQVSSSVCDFVVSIKARRGDTFSRDFFFEDSDGNAIDMGGFEYKCNLMPVEFIAPNQLRIYESAEDFAKRKVGLVEFDIWKERDMMFVKTIISGIFNVIKDNKS